MKTTTTKSDVYQMVTDRIIAELEKGCIPWTKPWIGAALCISHVTGKPYSLLNQILLGGEAGEYLTFKQAQEEGGHVRKGEKGKFVVFWKWLDKKDEDGSIVIGDNGKPEQVPFLRYYTVFHVNQCDGITPRYEAKKPAIESDLQPDERAESVVKGYVDRSHVHLRVVESSQAYYQPSTDTVVVPLLSQHRSVSEFYSTLFHELTHSTGHSSRLDRIMDMAAFGSETYSKEELVAEMGAAMLVNIVGLESDGSFSNSATYIKGWLRALKEDKKLIVGAASKAEKAVRFILCSDQEGGDEEC